MKKMIKVLVIDDSALIRKILTHILSSDENIVVVGAARDPLEAREMIKQLHPDVLTLDVEMPRMDGLSFLEKLMSLRPMPVIMVSTRTERGAETTFRALELGAVDFVAKPTTGLGTGLDALRDEIVAKIKAAANVRPKAFRQARQKQRTSIPKSTEYQSGRLVVAIGASTGGVVALQQIIQGLSAPCPGILITQHMPPGYTSRLAHRLNNLGTLQVAEASDGLAVLPGHAYIAPGGVHLELGKRSGNYVCRLNDGPSVSGHKPSVDILFESVAVHAGDAALGVILTGMGRDGADGLLKVRNAGGRTFGQDEQSCVVYGMPKAARMIGAVCVERPVDRLASEIMKACTAPSRLG